MSLLTEGEWVDGASNSASLKTIDFYVLCGRHIKTLAPGLYEFRHLKEGCEAASSLKNPTYWCKLIVIPHRRGSCWPRLDYSIAVI
ncbi:MAG: hypothetical protein E7672_04545 [Ruminococcaceae bacterium]|nr:hypothetical protein [Oscillospiraceae bacterium]